MHVRKEGVEPPCSRQNHDRDVGGAESSDNIYKRTRTPIQPPKCRTEGQEYSVGALSCVRDLKRIVRRWWYRWWNCESAECKKLSESRPDHRIIQKTSESELDEEKPARQKIEGFNPLRHKDPW